MQIVKATMEYFNDIVDMAYDTYLTETSHIHELRLYSKSELSPSIENALQKETGLIYIDDHKVLGFLLYNSSWNTQQMTCYSFPIWGYGAITIDRGKILSRLFEQLADELLQQHKIHFEIKLYAHDEEIIKLFSFLQFGIQCEEGIRNTNTPIPAKEQPSISFRELSKAEMSDRWSEIWTLLDQLIGHLRKSPVFYPGHEFTQEVYHEFLTHPLTRLFIAEKDDALIGVVEANPDGNSFISDPTDCYNIGDIFVTEAYRGQQVSQGLLKFANDTLAQSQIHQLWLEHGTANPNGRNFWDKYFSSYAYTMLREIEPLNK